MAEIESKRDEVPVTFTRVEAAALLHASEVGVRVIEALSLVQRIGTTETAVNKLRAAVAHAELPQSDAASRAAKRRGKSV